MGKRLIRILPNEFDKKLSQLQGNLVNLILRDNRTIYGVIEKIHVGKGKLVIKDTIGKTHKFDTRDMREVIYDIKTDY